MTAWDAGGSRFRCDARSRVDLERLEHAGVHVVGPDQHGQFDDLALVEMRFEVVEHGIRNANLGGHGVGVGERRALARVEVFRGAPVGERVAFRHGQSFGDGEQRHVLLDHVGDAIEVADADDGDLAQPAVELGLPARRADQVEPCLRQRRAVQQQLVDIDQHAAPARAQDAHQLGQLRMVLFFDVGDAGHGFPALWVGERGEGGTDEKIILHAFAVGVQLNLCGNPRRASTPGPASSPPR